MFHRPTDQTFWRCRWDEIVEVVAWKDDVFSYDIICVGLRIGGETEYLRMDETQMGWPDLLQGLRERLKVSDDWLTVVAYPPFALEWTVLWEAGQVLNASGGR